MGDVAWGGVLLTGALWVVRPVWRWRNVRRLGKLVTRWRRSLRHAPQPAKAAEVNAAPEQAEPRCGAGALPLGSRAAPVIPTGAPAFDRLS